MIVKTIKKVQKPASSNFWGIGVTIDINDEWAKELINKGLVKKKDGEAFFNYLKQINKFNNEEE